MTFLQNSNKLEETNLSLYKNLIVSQIVVQRDEKKLYILIKSN